jgi:outer membrane lipoprotein SlyB
MKRIIILSICMIFIISFLGCASSMSGSAYSRAQARQVQTVREGTVVAVRPIQIEGTKSGLGTIGGGLVGGAIGQTIGGGSGRILSTVVGGVGGAVAGSAIEEGVTRQNGLEISVQLDSGPTIAIVQAADEPFYVGDRVRIIEGSEGARVTH